MPPYYKPRAVIALLLRLTIYAYLFSQAVISYIAMLIGLVIVSFEIRSTPPSPPDPQWLAVVLFGVIATASIVVLSGLVKRCAWKQWRQRVLLFAIANVIVSINPIILIHEVGNTSWQSHLGYGFPLIFNSAVLCVIKIKGLHHFIFDSHE